jgi:predicted secreted protein
MGASGIENFIFKALKLGSTKIKMAYKRSWEKGSRNEKEFFGNIVYLLKIISNLSNKNTF